MLDDTDNNQPSDVKNGAKAIVNVLTNSGLTEGREIFVILVFGSDADAFIQARLTDTEALLTEWKDIIYSIDYPKAE